MSLNENIRRTLCDACVRLNLSVIYRVFVGVVSPICRSSCRITCFKMEVHHERLRVAQGPEGVNELHDRYRCKES